MRVQGRIPMWCCLVMSVFVFAPLAKPSTPPAATDASDAHEKMSIWVGRWKEVVETKETPYGHAHSTPYHVTCDWSADKGYMVCEYLSENVDTAGGEPADHLTIFAYDDKSKTYKHLGISKDYKTLEEPNVVIEGNRWYYTYQVPDGKGGNLDLRDSYEFVTPEKRITRREVSSDGGQHWTLLSESVGTKVH